MDDGSAHASREEREGEWDLNALQPSAAGVSNERFEAVRALYAHAVALGIDLAQLKPFIRQSGRLTQAQMLERLHKFAQGEPLDALDHADWEQP